MTIMETKKYVYALVGAPVATVKAAKNRVEEIRSRLERRAHDQWEDAQKRLEDWAKEGEQVISRLKETKPLDELAARVDLDQVQGQVTKLRDQLEDLLDTWRSGFRPETVEEEAAEIEKKAGRSATTAKATSKTPAQAGAKAPAKPKAAGSKSKKPAAEKGPGKAAGTKSSSTEKPAQTEQAS